MHPPLPAFSGTPSFGGGGEPGKADLLQGGRLPKPVTSVPAGYPSLAASPGGKSGAPFTVLHDPVMPKPGMTA